MINKDRNFEYLCYATVAGDRIALNGMLEMMNKETLNNMEKYARKLLNRVIQEIHEKEKLAAPHGTVDTDRFGI